MSPARAAARRKPVKRLGCEVPRIWTRPLRELTPQTSLGFSVIEFAETVLLVELLPWQRWLLIHMLELLPNNMLRFRKVVVLVARQNGKSTLSQVLALWAIYIYDWALVLGTAQDLDTAEEVWQGAVDMVEELDEDDVPVRPDLLELLGRVVLVNGKKSLDLLSGNRYKVKAANRRAGRGLSGDLILLDELREHQSWHAWSAITKTTNARANALVLGLSNAGDDTSIVLRWLRAQALHALIADGFTELASEIDETLAEELARYAAEGAEAAEQFANEHEDDQLGLFEWSAPPGCSKWDRDGWAQANPALGYTISERTIASDCASDPDPEFRTEVLCQWVASLIPAAIDPLAWAAIEDEDSRKAPNAAPVFGISVPPDRARACIGWAAHRADDLVHLEVRETRRGLSWVPARIVELAKASGARVFTIDPGSPAGALIPDIEAALRQLLETERIEVELVKVSTRQWAQACGSLLAAITGLAESTDDDGEQHDTEAPTVRHIGQPELDDAAAAAIKRQIGKQGLWAWGSVDPTADIFQLEAVTLARYGLLSSPPAAVAPSVYEARDLMVV